MKTRSHFQLLIVAGMTACIITLSTAFSWAQRQLPVDTTDTSWEALQKSPWFTKRATHPACPNCFKINDGRYGIFEEVPGTGIVISRDIPDPAPLRTGGSQEKVDSETGEPIWYKGNQGFVGPTDEEPFTVELPIPRIELRRIKARHERQIMTIQGVNLFALGARGFVVRLDPNSLANKPHIPDNLEGIPVEVEEGGMASLASHQNETYGPAPLGIGVPLGVGIRSNARPPSPGNLANGTLGPSIVRDVANIGTCCQLLSLTATHVVKTLNSAPLVPNSPAAVISQGNTSWGTVVKSFQLQPCGTTTNSAPCYQPNPITNDMRLTPDAAVIAHVNTSHMDPYPKPAPCSGSREPTRKMQYGRTSYVHGPSGLIRIAQPGTSIKMWGAFSDAPKGTVQFLDGTVIVDDAGILYCFTPIDVASIERIQGGDSGALVAWNGSSTRHVTGLAIGQQLFPYRGVYYIGADYLVNALFNAGLGFNHYWGYDNTTVRRPSATQYDDPC
jgi:hypothetical protein